MPIYEFYCPHCHTVFSFFSRTVDTSKRPACPRCNRPELTRQMSRFAISKGQREGESQEEGPSGPDDERIAQALEQLAAEHDHANLDDPRQAIPMIQKMYEIAGVPIPEKARELIRRIEAGEDPERVEEELGGLFEDDDSPFDEDGPLRRLGRRGAPSVDETLYDM